jgi:hypothetical protein
MSACLTRRTFSVARVEAVLGLPLDLRPSSLNYLSFIPLSVSVVTLLVGTCFLRSRFSMIVHFEHGFRSPLGFFRNGGHPATRRLPASTTKLELHQQDFCLKLLKEA